MIKQLLSLIFGNEKTKIKAKIDKKYKKAVEYQRNGNIREYSVIMAEIASLEEKYLEM